MIAQLELQAVKSQIVSIISERIQLTKKSGSWVGLCPFHPDQQPSFSVSEQKQLWRCWTCGIGGDVISFIQKFHDVNFKGALQILGIADNGQKIVPRQLEAASRYDDIRRRREVALTKWQKEFDEQCLLSRCFKRMMATTAPPEHEAWWYTEELTVEQRLDELEEQRRGMVKFFSGVIPDER